MKRFSIVESMVEEADGEWVDFTDAQADVSFLVNLIREAHIHGTEDEYEAFDEICENWDV